jgi:beta-lactamase class A
MIKLRWFLPGLVGFLVFNSAAEATTLEDWQFNATQNQLQFTTDSTVRPRVQLIPNPTRLVIDLPGVVLGHPQIRQGVGSSVVQEVRLGQFQPGTARLVIQLAPGYTMDPSQVQVVPTSASNWSVQLPPAELLTDPLELALLPDSQPIYVPPPPPSIAPGTLFAGVVPINQSLIDLQMQVEEVMANHSFLEPGMFFLDLETGNYLDIDGDRVFPAASTIKLPILIAFFQALDEGEVSLDETLTMRSDLVASGSGNMQYERVGTRFSALETITRMITISDNTATNMIIDRLGGLERLNERFRNWGLEDTRMRRLLGDFRGTNTTSSQDMVRLLTLLTNDQLLTESSKNQALDILRRVRTRTLLPPGLDDGADIAHKTGDIGFLIGDTGVITMPDGRQYLAAIYVRRPYDDVRARYFVQQVSRLVYRYLDQSSPTVSATEN